MVKKRSLFLIASIVWLFAGINVLQIGLRAYIPYISFINIVLSIIVFSLFDYFVFSKLVKKHHKRIRKLPNEKHYFYQFFDLKSFMIMAFMMTFGIVVRKFNLLSDEVIAVFYSGLGSSLALAGLRFLWIFRKEG